MRDYGSESPSECNPPLQPTSGAESRLIRSNRRRRSRLSGNPFDGRRQVIGSHGNRGLRVTRAMGVLPQADAVGN
jgi:hypothetical protein